MLHSSILNKPLGYKKKKIKSENRKTTPERVEAIHYFFRMGLKVKHADAFLLYYRHLNWQLETGQPIKNWKSLAFNWVCSFQKANSINGQQISQKRKL